MPLLNSFANVTNYLHIIGTYAYYIFSRLVRIFSVFFRFNLWHDKYFSKHCTRRDAISQDLWSHDVPGFFGPYYYHYYSPYRYILTTGEQVYPHLKGKKKMGTRRRRREKRTHGLPCACASIWEHMERTREGRPLPLPWGRV